METTNPRAADDGYDEYDATLDADASLVDWTAVPLAIEPTISPTNTQAHTPENGISRRNSPPGTSDDYGEDDYDDSFLVQLTQLEANSMSFTKCGTFWPRYGRRYTSLRNKDLH